MPQNPSLSPGIMLSAILASDSVIDSFGQIPGPSSPTWKAIADVLNNKVTAKTLYTYVKLDRYGFYSKLLETRNISPSYDLDESSEKSDSEDFSDQSAKSTPPEPPVLSPQKTFIVVLTPDDWIEIQPIKNVRERKGRNGKRRESILPPYRYQSIITERLWEQHKLPCPYTYRNSYVSEHENRDQYLKITAECKECGASAEGRIITEPTEGESVKLLWRAHDTTGRRHTKRRPLRGEQRRKIGRQLQQTSCAKFERDHALETMEHGDPIPPHAWSNQVLRQAKLEVGDVDLGVVKGTNVINNLIHMKHQEPFAGSIQDIGADKFYVHYRTPSQMEIYRSHRKTGYVALSIDATGSLVKKISRPHGNFGHIFLYEAVIRTGGNQYPVTQMLSEKNDSNHILYWLNEWERSGAQSPQEVVVDNSPALKAAVARSFCRCKDLQELRKKCFDFLMNRLQDVPPCYLRLDVAHIMNSAKNWKLWSQSSLRRLKGFYLSCLGVLVTTTELEDFREVLKSILIVALSPRRGQSLDGRELPMEDSLNALSRRITGTKLSSLQQDAEEEDNESPTPARLPEDTFEQDVPDSIQAWLETLWKEAEFEVTTITGMPLNINPYESREIALEFRRISIDFPFWTAVLKNAYQSPFLTASSAPVESDFKDLKQSILKGTSGLRVDKLLALHLRSIDGKILLKCGKEEDRRIERAGERRANVQNNVSSRTENEHLDGHATSLIVSTETQGQQSYTLEYGLNEERRSPHIKKEPQIENEKVLENSPLPEEEHDSVQDNLQIPTHQDVLSCLEESDKEEGDLNSIENWRNKAEKPFKEKTPARRTKIDCNPDFDIAIRSKKTQPPKARLLLNGNRCGAVSLGPGSRVLVSNTCPFDALAQILATAYVDKEAFKQHVDGSENHLLITAKSLAICGAVSKTYVCRAEALSRVLEPHALPRPLNRKTRGNRTSIVTLQYNSYANAERLAALLLKDSPSVIVVNSCPSCSLTDQRNIEVVNVNMKTILKEGFSSLKTAIEESFQPFHGKSRRKKTCSACGTDVASSVSDPWLLVVNVDYISDSSYSRLVEDSPHNRPHALAEIPPSLEISSKCLVLAGVVAYTTGHYIGYAKRQNGLWEEYDDLARNVPTKSSNVIIKPHLLVYTV